jgi:hypothetical protein
MGMLGIILSFLVPDRKKSFISLIMAGVIILTGLIQLSSQSITRFRWNQRMKEMRERPVDFDALRQRMQTPGANAPAAPAAGNTNKKK